jgi:hypothetical protein
MLRPEKNSRRIFNALSLTDRGKLSARSDLVLHFPIKKLARR